MRCCVCRPGRCSATPSVSSSKATSTISSRPTRCVTCFATIPRRATTRCGWPSAPMSPSSLASRNCPTSRCPKASTTTPSTSTILRGKVRPSVGVATPPGRFLRLPPSALRSNSRSLPTWGSAATSSSCGTSSSTRRTKAFGWVQAEVRRPVAQWRIACVSPNSIPSDTTCCSSAS